MTAGISNESNKIQQGYANIKPKYVFELIPYLDVNILHRIKVTRKRWLCEWYMIQNNSPSVTSEFLYLVSG
jgi:hypothetical protein